METARGRGLWWRDVAEQLKGRRIHHIHTAWTGKNPGRQVGTYYEDRIERSTGSHATQQRSVRFRGRLAAKDRRPGRGRGESRRNLPDVSCGAEPSGPASGQSSVSGSNRL